MNMLVNLISKALNQPLVKGLINRLINRYTSSGVIIVLMQLETMEILPKGVTKAVEGVPARELLMYIVLGIGIYLIMHKPKFKSKLEKIKEEIEIEKAKKELRRYKEEEDGNK